MALAQPRGQVCEELNHFENTTVTRFGLVVNGEETTWDNVGAFGMMGLSSNG